MKTAFEFVGNCSGFRRTRSHLLPALLRICYQHYPTSSSPRQWYPIDIHPLVFRSLEVRGFELKERREELCGLQKIWLHHVDEQDREIGKPELLTLGQCAKRLNISVRESVPV